MDERLRGRADRTCGCSCGFIRCFDIFFSSIFFNLFVPWNAINLKYRHQRGSNGGLEFKLETSGSKYYWTSCGHKYSSQSYVGKDETLETQQWNKTGLCTVIKMVSTNFHLAFMQPNILNLFSAARKPTTPQSNNRIILNRSFVAIKSPKWGVETTCFV